MEMSRERTTLEEDDMDPEETEEKPPGRVVYNEETKDKYIVRLPIGFAYGAMIIKAAFFPNNFSFPEREPLHYATVSMKMVNLCLQDVYEKMNQEVEISRLAAAHDNIVGVRDAFSYRESFYVVMPCMESGSLRTIMGSRFPYGFPEECIAVALRETLRGLSFLHGNGHVHKEINGGHIFLSIKPAIQLAFSATIYEHIHSGSEYSSSILHAFDICTWGAAPEVYNSNNEYTGSADIWMIGITALEFGSGGLRVADRAALEEMIKKMIKSKRLPKKEREETAKVKRKSKNILDLGKRLISDMQKMRRFSKAFEDFVVKCLAWDAAERPTADQLLHHKFISDAKDVSYFDQVIKGIPIKGHN